ncbi:hypothetical protein BTO20_20120 [Mycobacterium dioxanotrophicus]|uniref:Uncharacterized protein n=2 Tax=Mycobacterium dioxanotrophicus TaxID=482462 RepID=A0A1Y0C663_9MYCO|nr:hypothetical protein BTO20_20120 [Mycobacterium dioxanotrophicus]
MCQRNRDDSVRVQPYPNTVEQLADCAAVVAVHGRDATRADDHAGNLAAHFAPRPTTDAGRISTTMPPMADITARSLELFLDYARDADNWGGTPLVGGNVGGSREDNGNLTQLKQAGLVTTFNHDPGDTWIRFTEAGRALAAEHGVEMV